MPFARYHRAVEYLQERLWRELPIRPIEEVLQDRIRHLLAEIGDPHLAFPVVHVGGSAGKGSTSTMIASILRAAKLRTGLYTSPHLQTFLERYDVDSRLIDPDRFADLVLGMDPLVQRMLEGESGFGRPSLVEVAFAAGMRHFADESCDAAVVEVGLGGRTDCTNVFDRKPVTVLTNIELEHTERLGHTREEIAAEKAHLIRADEITISGEPRPGPLAVISARCDRTGSELWSVGAPHGGWAIKKAASGTCTITSPFGPIEGIELALPGAHQRQNALVAAAAAIAFGRRTGTPVHDAHVREGLRTARISCRMELMQESPRVYLDGAHNPAEAEQLAVTIRELTGRGAHLVCGILRDKDRPSMVRALAPVALTVTVTQPPLEHRQGDPHDVAALFREALGPGSVSIEPDPMRALDAAIGRAGTEGVVVVAGSMFLAGAARERWIPEERILARRSSQ